MQQLLNKENINIEIERLSPNIVFMEIIDQFVKNITKQGITFIKFKQLLNSPTLMTLLNIDKTVTHIQLVVARLKTFLSLLI